MAVGDDIQKSIAGAGEESLKAVKGAQEFSDIPTIEDEPQSMVDENAINESFDPANNALDGLREGGAWLFNMISDFFTQLFGNLG